MSKFQDFLNTTINNKTGFFQAKYQPLRQMEEIFIYYKKRGTYNPQMIGNEYHAKRNVKVGGRNGYYGEKLKDKDQADKWYKEATK